METEGVNVLEGFMNSLARLMGAAICIPDFSCISKRANDRQTQEKFLCVDCGYENHADVVGAINVLERGQRLLACGELVQLGRSAKQEPTEAIRGGSMPRSDAVGIPVLLGGEDVNTTDFTIEETDMFINDDQYNPSLDSTMLNRGPTVSTLVQKHRQFGTQNLTPSPSQPSATKLL